MKKLVAVIAALMMTLVFVAPAAEAAPDTSNRIMRLALKIAWGKMSYNAQSNICTGFDVAPRYAVRAISKAMIEGGEPAWQVHMVVRRFLNDVC